MKTKNLTSYILVLLGLLCSIPNFANTNTRTGRLDRTLVSEGKTREYIVHIPASYTGKKAMPVVFMFHGSGGTGEKFWNISRWKELGEVEGFISVYPYALEYCYEQFGQTRNGSKWLTTNVKNMLCPGQKTYDDVVFVEAIANELLNEFNVDKTRIYACGFSNGAAFVNSALALESTDLFAALATVAGFNSEPISIANPLPYYAMIGGEDPKIQAARGVGTIPILETPLRALSPIWDVVEIMLANNKLTDASSAQERPNYLRMRFTTSTAGLDNEMIFVVVRGLEHKYPNGTNNPAGLIASKQFFNFFMKHHK